MKKKIAIIFGGRSTEYPVSLQSASSVIRHMNEATYQPILIGITIQGKWLRYNGPVEKIENDTWFTDESCIPAIISPSSDVHGILEFHRDTVEQVYIDAAFPVMHGKNGEDGTMQGLLDLSGIPYIGCGTLCSALCMDKDFAHGIARSAGIKVPEYVVINKHDDLDLKLSQIGNLGYPMFVKPARSGSSFGITKVINFSQVEPALALAFEHDTKAVVEKSIPGFEVGCAVMGGSNELTIGEVDEIELLGGFFDYTEKYRLITSKIHMPARISREKAEEIKETAKKLYRVLECRGFARVDMFLTPDGEIVFNEINTIPGFTSHSRFPNMLGGIGISFDDLIDRLIGSVI